VSPLAPRLALASILAALLSGCVVDSGVDAAQNSNPGGTTSPQGLNITAATGATTDAATTDGETTATPSEVPDFETCRATAEGSSPVAVLRVTDASAQPQGNITINAMHEWYSFDKQQTDGSGCITFGFDGPGEYQFVTEGGDCERQGTTTIEWDGLADVNMDLSLGTVCNYA
jgi:hypothetical protein